MVMNAEDFEGTGTGDWLKQLKKILQLGADDNRDYGNDPKAEHRSTKTAVKLLLSNLRKGVGKMPDGNTNQNDKDMVVFKAVELLIRDKVAKSKEGKSKTKKTKLEALAKFEDVLRQEFAAQANKKGALDNTWDAKIKEALEALRVEELDKLVLNKDQDELETMIDANSTEPRKLREHCVRKMLASEDGKKALALKSHVSVNALNAVRDPAMSVDLIASLNPSAYGGKEFGSYVKSLGNAKDDILADALLALSKRPLPTDKTAEKKAKEQALAFTNMAKSMDPAEFAKLAKKILNSNEGKQALVDNPKLGGALFSSIDPDALQDFDFDVAFPNAKDDILGEALLTLSQKKPVTNDGDSKPPANLDPKLFKLLATTVDAKVWNDKTATAGVRKGLGARVSMELWNAGGYEQVCDLIKHGVDTSLPTRVTEDVKGDREGFYSGFVQPTQHIISKYLRDVGRLEANDPSLEGVAKTKAEGAKKIFAALDSKEKQVEGTAKTLNKWSEVKGSEMIKAFEEKPGTIWGFEDVRMPYVQAGHESDKGSRPLRMWELWDALGVNAKSYGELLQDPEGFANKKVQEAAQTIKNKESKRVKYADIKDLDAFVEEFKKEAKAVLLEFAAQLPKGTLADISKEAGFEEEKFLGGLACKAGLWWAKEQKEPVYYCLDGVDMKDVIDYKKLKNAAIDDFLAGQSKKKHDEVITMVEIREILKNWDDLKFKNEKGEDEDVVKLVVKGKILTGDDLKDKVKQWKEDMEKVNKAKENRTPAPDFKTFTNELNKIDPGLLGLLTEKAKGNAKEANQDGATS